MSTAAWETRRVPTDDELRALTFGQKEARCGDFETIPLGTCGCWSLITPDDRRKRFLAAVAEWGIGLRGRTDG